MNLADAKRLAVKRGVNIRFGLRNGLECLIDMHGLGCVPALKGPPDFNLEDEFARAENFTLEAAAAGSGSKAGGGRQQVLTRRQLEELLAPAPPESAGKSAEE